MDEQVENLLPVAPDDLAQAIAFVLRHRGRRRVQAAGDIMAEITARHLVESLGAAGFVVLQRAPVSGGAAIGRGFEG